MTYKRFFLLSLFLGLLLLLRLPVMNVTVDYYRVFNGDYTLHYPGQGENKTYLKTKWLLETKGSYDSIIFGSSRVIKGHSQDVLGEGWRKFDVPGSVPKEHLRSLKTLLENGVELENVILAIDDFDIYYDVRDSVNDFRYRPYPTDLLDRIDFFRFYLFAKQKSAQKRAWEGKLELVKSRSITEDNSTAVNLSDFQKHNKSVLLLDAWDQNISEDYPLSIDAPVNAITEFVRLCKDNDINVTVFMTPRHYKVLYSRNYPDLARFRQELAKRVTYWDFTNLQGEHWRDNALWFETSHYDKVLGEKVVKRINNETTNDFGVVVTELNSTLFVEQQYATLVRKLPEILAKDNNTKVHESYLSGDWESIPASTMPNYSRTNPSVLRVNFDSKAEASIDWVCSEEVVTKVWLNPGENERYLPWNASCNDNRAQLRPKQMPSIEIQSMAIAEIAQPQGL